MTRNDDIITKVAAIGDLPREDLVALWRKNFATAPPKGIHRELLIRAAAYHLQLKYRGGLSGEAKRLLKAAMREQRKILEARQAARVAKLAGAAEAVSASAAPPAILSKEPRAVLPGARLIREWNGNSHVVDVVDNGFIYAGSRYRSLSRIAREITGTNWSGPRFFGL